MVLIRLQSCTINQENWTINTEWVIGIFLMGQLQKGALTPAPTPAKPRPFFTPWPRPNVSNDWGMFAGVYLFFTREGATQEQW